jgi:hypothetical protein
MSLRSIQLSFAGEIVQFEAGLARLAQTMRALH